MAAPVENGKAPAAPNGTNGFRNGEISSAIRVQPPRREDLQPAYAQTLQGESEDAATHGWYGSMSMSTPYITRHLCELFITYRTSSKLTVSSSSSLRSQHPRISRWRLRRRALLHLLPEPIQTRQPGKCRLGHEVRPVLPRGRPRSCKDKPVVGEIDPGGCEDPDRWYV